MPATIRVLEPFGPPHAASNPYTVQLGESLESTPGVEVLLFDRRHALLGRYDVVHLHWPEAFFDATTPLRRAAKRAFFRLWLLRLRVTRTPIVRTVHNLGDPADATPAQLRLLRQVDAMTTLRIVLNDDTPLPPDQPFAVIPHGHYQDWFAAVPRADPVPGRLAFTGLIRRYKGVEHLLEVFSSTRAEAPGLSLSIGGRPSSPELADQVVRAAEDDPRILPTLHFLDDAEYVRAITEAVLVVLPYRFMHNSGSVLAVLSVGRPVLVPDNEVNRALATEVGPGWIHTYEGELDAPRLLSATAEAEEAARASAPPDLSARDWGRSARLHRDAFAAAIALKQQRKPKRMPRA